jgi:hypothetical protein
MAFGQASGPPAPQRRVAELAGLLEARGFDSFKEARHPFGLTQRQAAGKFTVAEVDELIERLEIDAELAAVADPESEATEPTETPQQRRQRERDEELAVRLDAEVMATELTNRGWCCIPPPD